jgi:hypothetical protein
LSKPSSQHTVRKNTLLNILTVCISLGLSLLAAEYILAWNQQRIQSSEVMEPGLIRYDAQIGWRLNANWQGRHSHYDYEAHYSTNAYGFRGDVNLVKKPADTERLALLGDSFTFGLGVNDDETFAVGLSRLDQGREYLNLGFPGYSTDQEYLYIEQFHRTFNIDHIVLIIYLGNDLLDIALDYPLQADNAKPYFSLNARSELMLENTPVPRDKKPAALRSRNISSIVFAEALAEFQSPVSKLVNSSHIVKMIVPEPSTDRIVLERIMAERLITQGDLMKALIDQFSVFSTENNMAFSIAVLPGRSFVEFPDSNAAAFQEYARTMIEQHTTKQEIIFMDVATSLRNLWDNVGGSNWYYPHEGHFTAKGHAIVAKILLEKLEEE